MVYICLHSLYHCQECADVRLAQAATRGELKDVRQALRALVHGGLLEARAEVGVLVWTRARSCTSPWVPPRTVGPGRGRP